jgi:CheY-like chemotaxis protein
MSLIRVDDPGRTIAGRTKFGSSTIGRTGISFDGSNCLITILDVLMPQWAGQSIASQKVDEGRPDRPGGRVMISGTHNDTRYMMRVLLEMWGYEVLEAAGEDETTRIAESEHPDLILVDTATKFEEDIKIVSRLRRSHVPASVPIIVLSGYPQADYQKAAFENGATGHLVKPLDLDVLEDYLETCLG